MESSLMISQLPELTMDEACSGQPKHQILKEYLVQLIRSGELKPGSPLPTELEFTKVLGVARNTVRRAMRTLEHEGLIRRIQGRGTFVHKEAMQRLQTGLALFALLAPEIRTGFYPSLLHGFEEMARETQHQAIICHTQNNADIQGNSILQLIDKQVTGVAIVPTTAPLTPAYQIRQLQKHNIPVVFLHRSVEGVQAPLLKLPYEKMGYLAGKSIVKHGHRHVAHICLGKSNNYLSGLRNALGEAGVELRKEDAWQSTCFSPETMKEQIPETIKKLVSQTDKPTAIFTSFDSIAELVYLELLRHGVRVPEDISLIGVGGAWREGGITPHLTSVVVDEIDVGRRAVSLLSEMQCGKRSLTDEEQFELPIEISEGRTLGPA